MRLAHARPGATRSTLGLARRFAWRVTPLLISVFLIISTGLPATYWVLRSAEIERAATAHAETAAHRVALHPDAPATSGPVTPQLLAALAPPDVAALRLLAPDGRVLGALEGPQPAGRARRWPPPVTARASVTAAGREVAVVEVALDRSPIARTSVLLFLLSCAVALALAGVIYSYSRRVVADLEQRLWSLVATLRRAHTDSERLRLLAEASERQYRDLVQGLDGVVWTADAAGRFLFVSDRAEPLLGHPPSAWSEAPGFRPPHVHADDRDRVAQVLEAVAADGLQREIEYRATAPDGRLLWLRDRVARIDAPRAEAPAPLLRGLIVDITTRRRAEDALRRSEEQYRFVVDSVRQVIFRMDARGRWTFLNPAWTDLTGFAVPESLNRSFLEYVHPEDRRRHAELLQPRAGSPEPVAHEVRYLTRVGDVRWVEVYASVSSDPRGRVTAIAGTLADVTDSKRTREDLARAQERLRHLLVSSPAVIYSRRLEESFPVTFVSANVTRLCGHEAAALTEDPQQWTALVHPDDAPALQAALARASDSTHHTHEYRIRCVSGAYRWVRDEWRVVREAPSLAPEIVGSVVDITERRESEAERARLSLAVEQATDAMVITAPEGTIVYVNPAGERLSGSPAAALVGRPFADLVAGVAGGPEPWPGFQHEGPWAGQVTCRRQGGSSTEVQMTIAPVREMAGALVNWVAVLRDASAERQMEAQLRQAQKLEAVGRLAGGIAHDFNNLLTVILGRCAMLRQHLDPGGPGGRDVALVMEAGERAAGLTRQLLAFSRKQVLAPTTFELNAAVGGLEKMLRRVIGEDIDLVTTLAAEPTGVVADRNQIEQVILNLVVNARDAMPRGGRLTIETQVLDHPPPEAADRSAGPCVMLAVSDTGCGMDGETMSHVFEPFFTTKGPDRGTGLGLSTVYGIVTQSGGRITVESAPGRGSTFRVYLPRVETTAEPAADAGVAPALPRGVETVLLAEDEATVRGFVHDCLAALGYRVLVAGNGRQALEVARAYQGPIHLLLTDVVMPGMGGQALAHRLSAEHPGLRILLMSGYADDEMIRRGILPADSQFLQKPLTPAALALRVRSVLDGVRPAQAEAAPRAGGPGSPAVAAAHRALPEPSQ